MEREHINPTGVYKHPAFTRVVTVKGPMKIIFIAGQTPSDENYQCIAPGDFRAQFIAVMESLDVQLKAAGASWDDVVYRRIFVLDVDEFLWDHGVAAGRHDGAPEWEPGRRWGAGTEPGTDTKRVQP